MFNVVAGGSGGAHKLPNFFAYVTTKISRPR